MLRAAARLGCLPVSSVAAVAATTRRMASASGPILIDGNATAATIRAELKERVAAGVAKSGRAPGLAVVLVGNRTDSATYVRMKKKVFASWSRMIVSTPRAF